MIQRSLEHASDTHFRHTLNFGCLVSLSGFCVNWFHDGDKIAALSLSLKNTVTHVPVCNQLTKNIGDACYLPDCFAGVILCLGTCLDDVAFASTDAFTDLTAESHGIILRVVCE